jgi:hypothetical protein
MHRGGVASEESEDSETCDQIPPSPHIETSSIVRGAARSAADEWAGRKPRREGAKWKGGGGHGKLRGLGTNRRVRSDFSDEGGNFGEIAG